MIMDGWYISLERDWPYPALEFYDRGVFICRMKRKQELGISKTIVPIEWVHGLSLSDNTEINPDKEIIIT